MKKEIILILLLVTINCYASIDKQDINDDKLEIVLNNEKTLDAKKKELEQKIEETRVILICLIEKYQKLMNKYETNLIREIELQKKLDKEILIKKYK
jgi:uncharacterized membrane-anchored protein YhcB (DUF1043 family)